MHMIHSGRFKDKQVLLADKDPKQSNDRTWCFWEEKDGLFEPVVFRRWEKLAYHDEGFTRELNIAPYHYKMIRGADFYRHCFETIWQQPNFHFKQGNVEEVFEDAEGAGIRINGNTLRAGHVFNSIPPPHPQLSKKEHWLLQHFKGWQVETEQPVFDTGKATLMDFRTSQQQGTAFCYVLPFSSNKALVEYTLFSEGLLPPQQYDEGLRQYVEGVLKTGPYKVTDTEFGVIPMTNYRFSAGGNKIINIGTAGGQTKASSGYTFRFIQKHSAVLVRQFSGQFPLSAKPPARFHFYDSVLLNILHRRSLPGNRIFTTLFKKNSPSQVLKFLDNETSLGEELKIISTLPTLPFMKSAIQQVF